MALQQGGRQARQQAEPARLGGPGRDATERGRADWPLPTALGWKHPLAASRCGSRTVGPSGGARSVWSPALGLWQPRGSLRPQHCPLPTLQPFHCLWSPGWAPGHLPGPASLTCWAQPQGCRHPSGRTPLVRPSWKASLWRRHPFGFWPRSTHRLWTGPGHRLEPGAYPVSLFGQSPGPGMTDLGQGHGAAHQQAGLSMRKETAPPHPPCLWPPMPGPHPTSPCLSGRQDTR